MTRKMVRGLGVLATAALVIQLTSGAALARRPKKHKGGTEAPPPADSGGAMNCNLIRSPCPDRTIREHLRVSE